MRYLIQGKLLKWKLIYTQKSCTALILTPENESYHLYLNDSIRSSLTITIASSLLPSLSSKSQHHSSGKVEPSPHIDIEDTIILFQRGVFNVTQLDNPSTIDLRTNACSFHFFLSFLLSFFLPPDHFHKQFSNTSHENDQNILHHVNESFPFICWWQRVTDLCSTYLSFALPA